MLKSKFFVLEPTDCRYPTVPIAEASLLPLDPDDVETAEQEEDSRPNVPRGASGQSRAEVSWIWTVGSRPLEDSLEDLDARLQADLRIEWARAQSRVKRWEEEVELLVEEMRRVVAY